MTAQELSNMFNGQIPVELEHLAKEIKSLANRGLKPTIKTCLGASGATYYYVAADTTYVFDPPCAAVSIKVNLNNHFWYIYFRHGNAWLKRNTEWVASYLANRPLDHLLPMATADELSRWVWSKCGQGIGFAEGNKSWRLVQDACYRLWEADKVPDPKEEPKPNRKSSEPREPREQRKPRLAMKDVSGPDLKLDF